MVFMLSHNHLPHEKYHFALLVNSVQHTNVLVYLLLDCTLHPSDFISVDHMVSSTGGHIPFQVGCASDQQYKYCTLWADHHSKFLYGHLQETTTTKEMIHSKELFETFAAHYDVHVKHIHSDNGLFASTAFAQHLDVHRQHHTLCGVSTHWQNGLVKCYIGIITTCACTMLLHAMSAWLNIITTAFWSFTFKHAICLHNLAHC